MSFLDKIFYILSFASYYLYKVEMILQQILVDFLHHLYHLKIFELLVYFFNVQADKKQLSQYLALQ